MTDTGTTPVRRDLPVALLPWVAAAFAFLFIASAATQLKPLFWDTFDVHASLLRFNDLRLLLMTGAWWRALLVLPAVFIAARLYLDLRDVSPWAALAGMLLMTIYGILSAAAGWVGVVIGVPAEEYQVATDQHALQVLADSLFWVQDNLIGAANMSLAISAAVFSFAMHSRGGCPRWAVWAGYASVPCILVATSAFAFQQGGPPPNADLEGPVYAAGAIPAGLAFLTWLYGAARTFSQPAVMSPGDPIAAL